MFPGLFVYMCMCGVVQRPFRTDKKENWFFTESQGMVCKVWR